MSFRMLCCFFVLINLVFNLPSYASGLDDECKTFCTNNGFADGQYLPPQPDAQCNEGYEKSNENQICCCKPKSE